MAFVTGLIPGENSGLTELSVPSAAQTRIWPRGGSCSLSEWTRERPELETEHTRCCLVSGWCLVRPPADLITSALSVRAVGAVVPLSQLVPVQNRMA